MTNMIKKHYNAFDIVSLTSVLKMFNISMEVSLLEKENWY